ncbi:hypothetical protein GJ496_000616 [Pomphorhynchus laevis]|nr:hypothetical protein GJ496_000616 [Pomphorhynchus laevis]
MVRLTAELIQDCPQFMNAIKEYELCLRACKIPMIENLGATLNQFGCIDLSDNDLKKLENIPLLNHLEVLLLNNNRIKRISEEVLINLPNLQMLILTNNNIENLNEIDKLASLKKLWCLSFLRNPVAMKKTYRLYIIYKLPQVRVLDFRRIRLRERILAKETFQTLPDHTMDDA